MNKIKSIIAIMLLSVSAMFAQVPDAINFQAIARDAGGEVMSNTDIMIRLTVLDGSATGTEAYQELRALTTNEYGSFSFQIGRDADYVTVGAFADIIWQTGNKFLKLDYDPTNQFNWDLTLGTIEFVTVPFAFSAGSVAYIDMTGVADGDVLIYNSTTEKFEPGQMTVSSVDWSDIQNVPNFSTVATSGDYDDLLNLPTIPNLITDLSDVNTTGATNGQVLSYNGTNWAPSTVSSGSSLWTQNGDDIYFSSGYVGIGTNEPISPLNIVSTSSANQGRYILQLHNNSTDSYSATGISITSGSTEGRTLLTHFAPSYNAYGFSDFSALQGFGAGVVLTAAAPDGVIRFLTNQHTEKMRINSNGNVGIGTTDPTSKFQVVGLPEYADNAVALAGGLTVGAFYRTGDVLKIVH